MCTSFPLQHSHSHSAHSVRLEDISHSQPAFSLEHNVSLALVFLWWSPPIAVLQYIQLRTQTILQSSKVSDVDLGARNP